MKCPENGFYLVRPVTTKGIHLVIFLFLMLFFIPCSVFGAIPASERAALIALYDSTNGDSWDNNSGWKSTPLDTDGFAMPGTEDTWYGITVIDDSVYEVYLDNNSLSGNIPSDLEDLTNLSQLILSGNELTGSIPSELGNLTDLTVLWLGYNELTGTIPSELYNLANLTQLVLTGNQLTGSISSDINNLTNILRLDLSYNGFTGTVPVELFDLTTLTMLNLGFNELTGTISSEFGDLTNLTLLSLSGNGFTGTIPPELGNLANLTFLALSGCELTGSIPSQLSNLSNLESLFLFSNELSGSIPSELGDLSNLENLFLGINELTGSIPPELGDLTNLTILSLSFNQLSGTIPEELGDLDSLISLQLYFNSLTGSVPSELGDLVNLEELLLGANALYGEIPSGFVSLSNLTNLYLDYNALYTDDAALSVFIENLNPDWDTTQTIAPENMSAGTVTDNSVLIQWTPVTYTTNPGCYIVSYSTNSGGPYTYFDSTDDKLADEMTVSGLNPGTSYYFVVQTQTDPNSYNQIAVVSDYGEEVSATTSGGGGGGGSSSGIFGNINISELVGYHRDWTREDGTAVYMPVTKWIKALKGAQTHVETYAPGLADFIRESFDILERRAKTDPDGLLSRIGTSLFPLLGKVAETYLDVIDSRELMDKAYINTTISVEDFKRLKEQGTAVSSHVVEKSE